MATKSRDLKLRLKAVDKMTTAIDRVQKRFPKLTRSIKRASRTAKIFNAQTKKMREGMTKLGGSMKRVGAGMALGLTLPIIAMGAASVKSFADFQTGLRGVEKTTGLSRDVVAELGARFDQLSTTIPVTTAEMLELAQAGGQLGIKGTANIEKFTVVMAKLGRASDVAGEEGAKSIARILTVTGTGIGNVERFASALVDLGNNAAAGEQEILAVATRVAGQIGRFDVASDKVLGISTALKALGKNAESAGSVVGRSFDAIDQAIKGGGKQMMLLSKLTGITLKDLKKAFEKDAAAVFQKFVGGLSKVQKGGGNMIAVMSKLGLKGVRINDILGTLAKNPEVLAENMDRASRAFEKNTALQAEFQIQTESFNSEMKTLGNTFSSLGRMIGKELAPAIKFFGSILRSIVNFLRANPALRTLVIILGVLVAVMGPVIFVFGLFLTVLPALTTGAALLGIALLPLVIKFLIIGAAIAALIFVVVLLVKKWDSLVAAFTTNPFLSIIRSAFLLLTPLGLVVSTIRLVSSAFKGLDAFKSTLKSLFPKFIMDSLFGSKDLGGPVGAKKGNKAVGAAGQETAVNGAIDVNFKNAPPGTNVKARSEGPVSLNLGFAGGIQ